MSKQYKCVVCGETVFADVRSVEFNDIIKKHIVDGAVLTHNENLAWQGSLCSMVCYKALPNPIYIEVMVGPDGSWHRTEDIDLDEIEVNAKPDDMAPAWFPIDLDDEELDAAVHELVGAPWPTR